MLHSSVAQFVLAADALSIICVGVVETQEEVYESEKVSLLCSYFFLSLEDAEAVAREEFSLHFQHAYQHEDFLGAAELGVKGVH